MTNCRIAILDYGMGNIKSVFSAFSLYSKNVFIADSKIENAEKLVIPGVGNFGVAMRNLRERNLVEKIKGFVSKNKPVLGICLGLQILFEESEESKDERGIQIIKGKVLNLKKIWSGRIPHIGWSKTQNKSCPILKEGEHYYYYAHSFYVAPDEKSITKAECSGFTAAVQQDNIFGVQFHPEKSQRDGLYVIQKFAEI